MCYCYVSSKAHARSDTYYVSYTNNIFVRFFVRIRNMLVQRAAIGDVEFLEAAANGKERQGAVHAGADELQRQRIALAVEQYAFARRHAAIEFGVNIRMRAGQKNAVAEIEEFGEMIPCFVERLARYRQENGLAIGTAVDCRNIFLADRMKGMRSQHLHVAGNADDGPPA